MTLVALLCSFSLAQAQAAAPDQAQGTGSLEGHVQSARDKASLPLIQVQLQDTSAKTTTDTDGNYAFAALEAGAYTVVFSADGFETLTRQATVGASGATRLDVSMSRAARASEEIVVLGQRTPLGLARQAQREAENIVSVMPYAEIKKLPVVNAGDAVWLIPGVQLETDTGEGRFVNIRGLDSDLSSTTFGGVRLPPTDVTTSPYGGSRAVSFDAIPSEMIGAITVTKTNRPEQEAEAVGGTIEISPKTAPRTGKPYFADLHLGSGVEPLRNTLITDASIAFGGRLGLSGFSATADSPFSFVGVFSYYRDRRGVDDLEESYAIDSSPTAASDKVFSTLEQRFYRQRKQRHVYGGELGYDLNSTNRFYVRYYDFGVQQQYNRNGLLYNFSGTATLQADGSYADPTVTPQKYYRATQETFNTKLFTVGGNSEFDGVKLDYFLAHTEGSYSKPFDQLPVWSANNSSAVSYNNANADFPSYAVTGGGDPYDLTGYTFSGFSNSTQASVTKDWSAKINARVPTHFTDYPTEEIKVGAGARGRNFDQGVTSYLATTVPSLDLTRCTTRWWTPRTAPAARTAWSRTSSRPMANTSSASTSWASSPASASKAPIRSSMPSRSTTRA